MTLRILLITFLFFLGLNSIYAATPTITSISPTSGTVGTLVTINGTSLSNPTTFTIGGSTAIVVSNSDTQLVGMVMPGAITGSVSLTTVSGTVSGSNFTVITTLAPSIQQGDKLIGTGEVGASNQGNSVALSADGNTAIVGGYHDGSVAGAVWIYIRTGGTWSQQGTKLVGSGGAGSYQGYSVALSADGNTAIVGGERDNGGQGAVWIFTRNGGTWSQQGTKLVGTGSDQYSEQGYSVGLSADGNTAIFGGPGDNSNKGAVWVYTRSLGVWTQQGAKLVGTGASANANQGSSVSISADGNTAMTSGGNGSWIYTRNGGIWMQQGDKLVGISNAGPAIYASSVSLSADGNSAIVGGIADNSSTGAAAWIFTRSKGTWTQQGSKLVGSDNISNSNYQGSSYFVSISADGNKAILGWPLDNSMQGASWIFTRSGTTWVQQGSKLVGNNNAGAGNQGSSVALSADGNTALIGSESDNLGKGATWVYSITTLPPTITSFTPTSAAAGQTIYLTGTHLSNASSVNFGNIAAATFSIISDTQIKAVVGNGASGNISITTPGGIISQSGFTILGPSITSFVPAEGPVGTLVTITGTNLSKLTSFTIGGVPAIAISNTGTQLVGMVMPGAVTAPVSIVTGGIKATGSNFIVKATTYPSVQQGMKLVGPGGTSSAQGSSVALSADGNTAIVGGPNDYAGQGAAWIFIRNGGTWSSQGTKLVGIGNVGTSYQGSSVSLSADGNTAIVGGYGDNANQGAAWIFTRNGTKWAQQGLKLVGAGNVGAANQGFSVSLSADGNTAIVGGYNDNAKQGAIWIFIRSDTTWTQQGSKLVGIGNVGAAYQGYSASLSADGNSAIMGGYADNTNQGAAWVFVRNGTTWTQQGTKLVGTGNVGSAYQGYSVSISADGSRAIIGGIGDNSNEGAAWVFARNGTIWAQQGSKLVASDNTHTPAKLGNALSISADGNSAIVGGYSDNNNQGAIWVYTYSGSNWLQKGSKLVGAGNNSAASQGSAISLSADGSTTIIGGYNDRNIGASWVFVIAPSPVFTSFTPIAVGPYGTVTLTGTGFTGATTVSFGGSMASSFSVVSDTQINAVVGTGTSGSISITTLGGTALLSGFTFNAPPPPSILSVNPVSGPIGTLVTINGANLFGPTKFTIGGVTAIVVSNTGTQMVGMIMPGAVSGPISITTAFGNTTGNTNFTVTTTPYPSLQQGIKLMPVNVQGVNANTSSGTSVAISGFGTTAIVNSPNYGHYTSGFGIFTSTETVGGIAALFGVSSDINRWLLMDSIHIHGLQISNVSTNSTPGASVAISADGNTVVMGENNGDVLIYSINNSTNLLNNGNYPLQSSIPQVAGSNLFGASLSISADGNTLMVGDPSYNSNNGVGTVWAYSRNGSGWSQATALAGLDNIGAAAQGTSVALSSDGNTLIIGGPKDNNYIGAAWIFTKSGGIWSNGIKLIGSGASGASQQGSSVAISADGNTVIIGGKADNNGNGAVWIFIRNNGIWTQQVAKVVGSGSNGGAGQGSAVAVSADGNTLLVGGPKDNNYAGATWVFTRNSGVWTQQGTKLVAPGSSANGQQGTALAISSDGRIAVIGAPMESNNGAAWIFAIPPSPLVTTQAATSITESSAILQGLVNDNGATTTVSLEYGTQPDLNGSTMINFINGTNIIMAGTGLTAFSTTLTGLNSGTTYYFRLNGVSSNGKTNGNILSFTTLGQLVALPPNITSISNNLGITGTSINLTGNFFLGATRVSFGDTAAQSFTVNSATSITAIVGNGASGKIAVTTPAGTGTFEGFIYTLLLPSTNYHLTITGETCNGSSNGSVLVKADSSLKYTAILTGNGGNTTQKFTSTTTFNNLASGTYTLTFTVDGQTGYSSSYTITITQPQQLSVFATVNQLEGNIELNLSGGSVYYIQLNNKTYTTKESSFSLPMESGNNTLQVTTDRECQGIFTKLINPSFNIAPYPMPFDGTLNLNLGSRNIATVSVRIYSANTGALVYSGNYQNQSGVLQLDLSKLIKGAYGLYLKLNNNQKEFKIIK